MKMPWKFASLLAILVLVLPGFQTDTVAQSGHVDYLSKLPPLIDRELFFGDPEISGAQLSPDGRFVSFIKPYDGVMNIWVKGIDEPFGAARPITADTTRPVRGYFWSQDSRYVLYVQDKGGDENFHVYAVDPRGQAEAETGVPSARDLTPYEKTRAYIYAVPESTPNQIIVGLNDRDPAYHDVYRLELDTGKRRLVIQNNEKVAGWVFDLKGNLRLATRQLPDGGTEILRVDGSKLTQVYTCTNEETCYPVRFHKDGKRVYLVSNHGEGVDLTRLLLFDPKTLKEEVVESDPEKQVDFAGAEFSDATDELVATYYLGDRLRIYPKSKQFAADLELLKRKLPEGEIYLGSATEDEQLHIVRITRDIDPGSAYLYNRKTGDVSLLYRSRPELPTGDLAPMKPVRYTTRDGLEIPAYLTLPKGVEPEDLATVVLPHGGPWARDAWGYDPFAQFLANRGYAVLQPNFRGSTGYGKRFLNAGNKEWGTGGMQHDITDGVKYLIAQGIADPDRVGIFGGSYGGYATLAGLAFTPDLYAAGVSYVGPSNLITLLNSIPPYWAPLKKIFDVRLGNPDDPKDRERLMAQSPLFSAKQIKAPLLVIQGANDPRVKKAESEQIVAALRDLGRDVEYMLAEDEGHGFAGRENRLAVSAAMERFFADHIGGRYQKEMPEDIAERLEKLTVDVKTVKPPDMASNPDEENAPLPATDGSLLQPAVMHYKTMIQSRGQELTFDVTRRIEKATYDGGPVWRVTDAAQTPMGTALDTFAVDPLSLMPIHRGTGGRGTLVLNYTDKEITGEISMGGQTMPIKTELASPVFGDGPALELAIAGMPLTENYQATVRIFAALSQKVRPMKLSVTGAETAESAAGQFDTYVVELQPLDGDEGGAANMHVLRSAPHYLVKGTFRLPTMAGGGTATTELQARELLEMSTK